MLNVVEFMCFLMNLSTDYTEFKLLIVNSQFI